MGVGKVQAAVLHGEWSCSLGVCREINHTIPTQPAESSNPEGNRHFNSVRTNDLCFEG